MNPNDLTPDQLAELVRKVQAALLKQAKRSPRTIGLPKKPEEKIILASGDTDLTCCGVDMHYQDIFGIRRYYCPYRLHHPALYVRQSDGEMLREEDL